MKKLFIRMLCISLFMAGLCGSCAESSEFTLPPQGETPEVKPAVTVYPTAIRASATGGSFEVAVAANSAWQATGGSLSCKLLPALGSADEHTFTIEVAPNEGDTPLDFKIIVTVTNSEGSATEIITLTQENKSSKPEVKYGIATLKDLLEFAKAVNAKASLEEWTDPTDGVIKLRADIDMNGIFGWPGIGHRKASSQVPFEGIFDGNGFKILSCNITPQADDNDTWAYGLFANNNGTIRNVVIEKGLITGLCHYLGTICGWNAGIIENCSSNASVTSNAIGEFTAYAGGIVGYNNGTVKNSNTTGGAITGNTGAGGIAGYNNTGIIIDCTNRANIDANERIGGITTYTSGLIDGCINYSSIPNAKQMYASGIVTYINFNTTISNCTNYGDVTNEGNYTSGVASINWGTIIDCVNRGTIKGIGWYSAGIAAQNNNIISGTATRNYGNVTGDSNYVGGVAAYNGIESSISDAKNEGNIRSERSDPEHYVGGVAGWFKSSEESILERCENSGAVSGTVNYVGGVVGWGDLKVTACVNKGKVSEGRFTGGIIGRGSAYSIITDCRNEGEVTGASSDNQAGGIVGYSSNGKYTSCTNSGKVVSVGTDAGGISGYGQADFQNCTNTGTITCQNNAVGGITSRMVSWNMKGCKNQGDIIGGGTMKYAGGLAGVRSNTATITDCINDGSVNGVRPGPEVGKVLY